MKIEKDADLARAFPPPSVAGSGAHLSESLSTMAPPTMAWDQTEQRWNGFDSWSAKVEDYLKSGFVEPVSKPGFHDAVPHFQTFLWGQKTALNQYDDGETVVVVGQLYSVVDLAAAFRRLREETAFAVPQCLMVVDPRAPGKGFLAVEKIDCIDGSALEYQLLGDTSEDCLHLVNEIRELIAQAKAVLAGEFFVNLDNPCNWGLTAVGVIRAKRRLPLTQSDLVILQPIF